MRLHHLHPLHHPQHVTEALGLVEGENATPVPPVCLEAAAGTQLDAGSVRLARHWHMYMGDYIPEFEIQIEHIVFCNAHAIANIIHKRSTNISSFRQYYHHKGDLTSGKGLVETA